MPRLHPQKLSGLVVIPTVELDGLVYRVSLGIDVGESRVASPPPDVVTREDLVVELREATEGSFEAIGSPDPGPLPVRALRVVQARGEFTYGRGVNDPDELVVTLRGDQKSFPMSQTFPPTGGLSAEPQEGDAFQTKLGTGPPGLPLPVMRPRCCLRRFAAPLHVDHDASAKTEFFEMAASLGTPLGALRGCRCACCQYRQFVRGTFQDADGNPVRFDVPSGALDPAEYREDGSVDEFGSGKHGFYGHRDTSSPGDAYSGTGGCSYRAKETTRCPPTEGGHLEFIGLIVDVCRGRVAAQRKWVVDL
jgi:hypothetical protein